LLDNSETTYSTKSIITYLYSVSLPEIPDWERNSPDGTKIRRALDMRCFRIDLLAVVLRPSATYTATFRHATA
jgi:hypothetical protein